LTKNPEKNARVKLQPPSRSPRATGSASKTGVKRRNWKGARDARGVGAAKSGARRLGTGLRGPARGRALSAPLARPAMPARANAVVEHA
jgi:hypothetical protein